MRLTPLQKLNDPHCARLPPSMARSAPCSLRALLHRRSRSPEPRTVTAASPPHVEKHGRPTKPCELAHYQCIQVRNSLTDGTERVMSGRAKYRLEAGE